jgi:iron-sulfur cluster repair protein YtfE (RIC family)
MTHGPADSCRSRQALCAATAKLVDDLMEHIDLENNALFRYG